MRKQGNEEPEHMECDVCVDRIEAKFCVHCEHNRRVIAELNEKLREVAQRDAARTRMIDGPDHQLHAARYYVHKLRAKTYGDAVAIGLMGAEEARHHYALAMINFDTLMETSASGSVTDANQADMDKGFPL